MVTIPVFSESANPTTYFFNFLKLIKIELLIAEIAIKEIMVEK